MSLQPREWAAELGPAAMDYTFLWSRESGSSAWTLNFHHSTGHEVLEVPKICWKSEGPKPVFKVCLLSHVLPSLDVFPRMFKTPPTFLICDCDSTDLTQQICPWSLSKTVEWVCTRSSQPPASLLPVCSARQAWQLLSQRHGKLTVLDRLLEFCGTNDGPITPRAHGLKVPLGSRVQSVGMRGREYWQMTELRALFHYKPMQ